METVVDAMDKAYEDFVAAMADVLDAREGSGGQRTPATDAALDKFKHRWELFMASCDGAEQVVETARKRVASDNVADVACPIAPERSASTGPPPLSVARLERGFRAIVSVDKALRCQNADHDAAPAAAAAAADSSRGSPDDAKPSEDEAK